MADGVGLEVRTLHGAAGGVPFLLVHGLASNARMWDGVAERLHHLGHPSAAVDLRGHGLSDKPDDGYDYPTVVADACRVMDDLGYDRPVAVGQSWGGNVVVELAVQYPERVRGIACVDGGWIELADRFDEWEACAEALAPPPTEGMAVADLERQYRETHPGWPDEGVRAALASFEARPDGTVQPRLGRDRHLRILREMWSRRPSTRYPDVQVAVLLVPADRGGHNGWQHAIEAAEATIPRVRCQWLHGDHDLHAHRPDELARMLHEAVEDGFFA